MAENRLKKPTSTRCAVYTRKSTEEGLEQAFNSLDAQREACEAYVLSQRHEGWLVIPAAYDDGGFSGGSTDRPGLQALLADIRSGSIGIVVVYKVDRLTRALSDFAKIVEIFDAHGVSFVSVTQAFNTTTSMGRLTLNVLLSFAQFEREVTAERIRDKIAASKKKGMWMGGFVPLGYDAIDKKLVVNETEAKNVRTLFNLYLELGNIAKVKAEADRLGITTKERHTRDPRMRGGGRMWRGHVHTVLTNPLYLGKIRHKGEIYEGMHDGIIDQETWDRVQARLIENARKARGRKSAGYPSLLSGLLFTETGVTFTPSHAVKDGKRYRYYVERSLIDTERHAGAASSKMSSELGGPPAPHHRGWRLPAHELERAVLAGIARHLHRRGNVREILGERVAIDRLGEALDRAAAMAAVLEAGLPHDQLALVQELVERITIKDDAVAIAIWQHRLVARLGAEPANADDQIQIIVPIALRRRGVEMKLVLGDRADGRAERNVDAALLTLISQAQNWFERMKNATAQGPSDIAAQDGVARTDVSRALPLAFLAPDIVRAIVEGRQPSELTSNILRRAAPSLPSSWPAQRRVLGFDAA